MKPEIIEIFDETTPKKVTPAYVEAKGIFQEHLERNPLSEL